MDSISVNIVESVNESYAQHIADGEQSCPVYVEARLVINGVESHSCVGVSSLMRTISTIDSYRYYDGTIIGDRSYSVFEPFTCSCGVSGCAGIWGGIHYRARKYTIEWRVPKDMGYQGILDKRFYAFSREQYMGMVDKLRDSVSHYHKLYPDSDLLLFV